MDSGITVWSRTPEEWRRLHRALEANCECEYRTANPESSERCATCPVRLLNDQAALDRFGFVCSIAIVLIAEENVVRRRRHP